MKTRTQTRLSHQVTPPQPSVKVKEEEPLIQLKCPQCQLEMPSTKMQKHVRTAHPETPPQCEFCEHKQSDCQPQQGKSCSMAQLFNAHRGRCKKKWLASQNSQKIPLPAHSNQTLPDRTQLFSEQHHNETSAATADDEIKVKYEPVMHESEPDQAVERKAPLKTPPESYAVKW